MENLRPTMTGAVVASSLTAVFLLVTFFIGQLVLDHMRLVQVRQLLMDHGTPIEMDRKN